MSIRRTILAQVRNFRVGLSYEEARMPLRGSDRVTVRVWGLTTAAAAFASTLTISRRVGDAPPVGFAVAKTLTAAAPTLTLEAADLAGVTELVITTNANAGDALLYLEIDATADEDVG
jgi:hypothetical protein